jgi:HlyD family secretion protein
MRKKIIAAAIAVLLVVGIVLIVRYYVRNKGGDNTLALSGTVEVTEVNLGFKMPGRVVELLVDEGQRVTQGERLSSLDSSELRSIVAEARAAVSAAEANYEKANKDIERYRPLAGEGVITTQQLDSATRAHDVARSQLYQARSALRASEARLADMVLLSPVTGVVLSKNVERGETVGPGVAVYSLGDLEKPWVKVYVNETKLGLVKLGQQAQIFVDTYPGKSYEGRVTYIASEAEFTPKTVQTQEERVKLVFGVKVGVQNIDDELKPGMPADVKILLR